MLTSIRQSQDRIEIVNQLLLPHTTEWIHITSVAEAHEAIKSMKIRGAPAIASLASLSVAQYISSALKQTPAPPFLAGTAALKTHIDPILAFLATARPTAVNLSTATRRLAAVLDEYVAAGNDARRTAELLVAEAQLVADEDVERNMAMSKHGGNWLLVAWKEKDPSLSLLNVLTVCNTGSLATSGYGTALGLITWLHEGNHLDTAYYTQTAPYHQGSRLTALELKTLGVKSSMICDTMVGSLFHNRSIHAVVVGADRIARNGDTANKVGTYNAAVLAARHQIPFIVAAPVSTVDLDIPDGTHIPIEHRPGLEARLVRGAVHPPVLDDSGQHIQTVVMITPLGDLDVYNPSFDVTPAELVTAIVTEKGVAVKRSGESVFDLSSVV